MVSPRRALVSVSDKEGLVEFSRGLRALGFELIGSEGTAKTLKGAGLPVMTVADYTGLHEGLGGRVKTLHPKIFAGILAPRGDEKDLADLDAVPIDLVVVNLYPFETTVTKPGVGLEEAIENIDIGGVSLIRAAAKNATRVGVVVRPARYPDVLRALQEHRSIPEKLRNELAMEAFEYTSRYDAAIFNYFAKRQGTVLPPALRLAYDKVADLRYGENPYQKAALYQEPFPFAATATAEKLQGKELSYNNLIDLDAALRLATEFERPAAVVIKHTNPSGVALASTLAEAYSSAHAADPVSAYGGVVGLNRPVDLATAKAMKKDVLDAVIAPEYEAQALDLLKSKKKGTFLILRTRGPFRKDHWIGRADRSGRTSASQPSAGTESAWFSRQSGCSNIEGPQWAERRLEYSPRGGARISKASWTPASTETWTSTSRSSSATSRGLPCSNARKPRKSLRSSWITARSARTAKASNGRS